MSITCGNNVVLADIRTHSTGSRPSAANGNRYEDMVHYGSGASRARTTLHCDLSVICHADVRLSALEKAVEGVSSKVEGMSSRVDSQLDRLQRQMDRLLEHNVKHYAK